MRISSETHSEMCTLCLMELSAHPIRDGAKAFCCAGCHAVFNILSAKNQLEAYADHPVFQQALRSGLISNPALLEHIRKNQPKISDDEVHKLHLEINNMWCPSCAEIIRLILLKEKGVRHCVVDYATDLASIEYAPRYLSKEKICHLIEKFGYHPVFLEDAGRRAVSFGLYLRFVIAAFCALNVMMLAYPLYATYFSYDAEEYGRLFAWLSLFMSLPVLGYSAQPIIQRFFSSLHFGLFGMETLVIIGITAAFGLSIYDLAVGGTKVYFDSMTVIIVFVLLGKITENRAKFSSKEALTRLARATPRRGRKRLMDGSCQFALVKDIRKDDVVVAYAGEKIILDGVVIEGEGTCDESLMTGEALPVVKQIGNRVLSGSILLNGTLTFQVQTLQESVLHQIIEMIEKDISGKSIYVRAVDGIVRWFVPLILSVAALTALVCLIFGLTDPGQTVLQTATLRAIAVLLISCPCAIGIAAPLAESHLLNRLASLGAIVRNKACLPFLGKESVFIFDKTGTMTEGKFSILSGIEHLSTFQKSVLRGLALCSTHPIACAVANAIEEDPFLIKRVEEIAGRGIGGEHEGKAYLLGSASFLAERRIRIPSCTPEKQELLTTVYFTQDQSCLAAISLGDKIREGAKELIESLKPAKRVLLSGDSRHPVETVAAFCGFEEWRWGNSPLEKRECVLEYKQKNQVVCMIGDGINDAPALTAAHVGISVISASDMSIQVSDILLTTDRLSTISSMRIWAKKGRRILKQNLFWAFFYNVIGVVLAVLGYLSPIFAAFAMSASSLMVLFNARRL